MTYPVRITEEERLLRKIEAMQKQHATDIQRLWKRITQTPQSYVGAQSGSPAPSIPGVSGTGLGSGTGPGGGSGTVDASGSPDTGTA